MRKWMLAFAAAAIVGVAGVTQVGTAGATPPVDNPYAAGQMLNCPDDLVGSGVFDLDEVAPGDEHPETPADRVAQATGRDRGRQARTEHHRSGDRAQFLYRADGGRATAFVSVTRTETGWHPEFVSACGGAK